MFRISSRGEATTWAEMKELLSIWFLPLDYTQQICWIFNHLLLGNKMSVIKYTTAFFDLVTGSGFYRVEDVIEGRYFVGLEYEIHCDLAITRIWTVKEAYQDSICTSKREEASEKDSNTEAFTCG